MADLPSSRVQPHRPFLHVDLDYGGPFVIKGSRRRNARTSKAYLALFICMTVKAVHLEIVSDLTTDAFLAALDQFRGSSWSSDTFVLRPWDELRWGCSRT